MTEQWDIKDGKSMRKDKKIYARRIAALLLALTFILTGCKVTSSKTTPEDTTAEAPVNEPVAYDNQTAANVQIICPRCHSTNVGDALQDGETYEAHFICYDCNCEWYVENGTAYQITDDSGDDTVISDNAPAYFGGSGYTRSASNGSGSSNNGGSSGSYNGGNNGGNNGRTTTTRRTTTTTKDTAKQTWEDAKALAKFIASGEPLKYIKWYIDEDGNITTDGNKGVLGFAYSTKEKCFYADNNAWQRNFGYSKLYDGTSELLVISYDTIRVYFNYAGKDWMIQLWKGQYGFVLLGGEVGVYNRKEGLSSTSYFNCASDDERLPISLQVAKDGKTLFTRQAQESWWMTGFVPGQLGVGAAVGSRYTSTLSETTTITFDNDAMMQAFVKGLNRVTYIFNNVDYVADGANGVATPGQRDFNFTDVTGDENGDGKTPGTYAVNGTSVTLTWQ